MTEDPALITLAALASEIRACVRCPLHSTRKNTVPGDGASGSVMVIGEGPGRNEDERGLPFVGAAGHNLEDLLSEAGLSRRSVFITNAVKCRPPENRRPTRGELDSCHPFLRRQIEAVAPKVIVLLGDTALKEFFPESSLGRAHGVPVRRGGRLFFPSYHPASVIYNPSLKEVVRDDFRKLGELVRSGT